MSWGSGRVERSVFGRERCRPGRVRHKPRVLLASNGRYALEVAYGSAEERPNTTAVRSAWRQRHGRGAAPLLLVVAYTENGESHAMVCGPAGGRLDGRRPRPRSRLAARRCCAHRIRPSLRDQAGLRSARRRPRRTPWVAEQGAPGDARVAARRAAETRLGGRHRALDPAAARARPGPRGEAGAKHGFCFFDNYRYGSARDPFYTIAGGACGGSSSDPRVRMGLSVGWGDY